MPKAAQARFDVGQDVLAAEPQVVGLVAHGEAHLGGDHEVVAALACEPAADDLLRGALRVHVGRIDKVAAGGGEAVHHLAADVLAAFTAERHGAQAQLAYLHPGLA